jgi:photosystem II stability/assembly factor-like uncharacterized protein
MDPVNPTTLYTLDGKFRLSKSTDGGATWSRTGNGLPEHTGPGQAVYVVLAVSPENPQTLFAASPAESADNQGLYRSTDGGANWSRVAVGPFRDNSMFQLIVARASPNVLYTWTVEGLYHSTDGGANWSASGLSHVTVASLAIDPGNAAVVYVGTGDGRVLKSSDGGTSWNEASVGLSNPPVLGLVIDPRKTTNIYAGTAGGLFKSADSGGRWQEASSSLGARVGFLAAPGEDTLLADTGWRAFRSADGGESWERASLPGPAYQFAVDPTNANLICAIASTNDIIYKSTDGGANWSATPVDLSGVYLTTLAIAPGNPAILYAGANHESIGLGAVIRSTDGGARWAGIGKDLNSAYYLTLDPNNLNTLYALAYYRCSSDDVCGAVFKSTDGGASWNQYTSLQTDSEICSLTLDPFNPQTLYVGLGNRSVLKSTDGGATWKTTGLSPAPDLDRGYDNNLVIDPTNSETLYVGFRNVVHRTTDGGATWSDLDERLPPDLEIWEMALDPTGTSLHVGTRRGVFDYHFATPCAEPLSSAEQSFEAGGGAGFVEVTAVSECGWTAESNADWIRVTSASSGSGSGTVSYSVKPNESTALRRGGVTIGGRVLKVKQAGLPVRISRAVVSGKKLFVTGENFDPGAVLLLNGQERKTINDDANPKSELIGKKTGKKIKPGDKLRVRNPNGSLSEEFIFTGS